MWVARMIKKTKRPQHHHCAENEDKIKPHQSQRTQPRATERPRSTRTRKKSGCKDSKMSQLIHVDGSTKTHRRRYAGHDSEQIRKWKENEERQEKTKGREKLTRPKCSLPHPRLVRKHQFVLVPIKTCAAMCLHRRSVVNRFSHLEKHKGLSCDK